MPDWKTRLAVSFEQGTTTQTISPIDAYTPTFSLNAEVLHSIEDTHIGVIYSPESLSFSMTVKAIGPVAAQLTALALAGTRFNIVLQESDNGTDWAFSRIVMTDCIITSAMPTAATISGAPSATFSGFSLSSSVESKAGVTTTSPGA